jgi:GNAT superfamily N-acetyltransferase
MSTTLVDEWLTWFRSHSAEELGISPNDFMLEPSVVQPHPPTACSLQVLRLGERCAVAAKPEWRERVTALLKTRPWKEWLDSPQGFDKIVAALDEEPLDRTPRLGPYPVHSIGWLCDAKRFRPYAGHADRVVRLTPEHPLWRAPDEAAPERPFAYVIVEEGMVIARASVRYRPEVLEGRTWALGVSVKPQHRRKGYGKAVMSAATREIIEAGGLALWNTEADKLASAGVGEALGYERYRWEVYIPYRIERPGLVQIYLEDNRNNWAQNLGIAVEDFGSEPSVFDMPSWNDAALSIVRTTEGTAVAAVPELKERCTAMLRTAPWKEWLDSPQGLHEFLGALGLAATATAPGTIGPVHNIGLLCDAARFRPFAGRAERLMRITTKDPLWRHPDDPITFPFSYAVVKGDTIIAEAYVKHNPDRLRGRTWEPAVSVLPKQQHKGCGQAVVSAVTREIVEASGLAVCVASASDSASLGLFQESGYEKVFWHIRIPRETSVDEPLKP